MLNLETEMSINLRDIIWLNKMQRDWIGRKVKTQSILDDDDDDDTDVINSKIQLVMIVKIPLKELLIKIT
jgi:hypothetical protein